MKLNKIISLVLTAVLSATTLSVPVLASENETDRVIYEDNFDIYTGFSGIPGNFPKGENIFTESSPFIGENIYSIYALMEDGDNKSIQLSAPYNTGYRQYHPTHMTYLPDEELLTKETQMEKGNVKLGFSFRIDGVGEKHESQSNFRLAVAEKAGDDILNNTKFTMFSIAAKYMGSELKGAVQITGDNVYDTKHLFNKDQWYDVEMIYDLLGNNVNTRIVNQSDEKDVWTFDHEMNWCDPFGNLREFESIQRFMFKINNGLMVSVDNFKLEYYLKKPEISPKDVIVTDYRGQVVENLDAVSPAVVSIKLPFGTIMSEDSTNTETITLKDSYGNEVAYIPEYGHDSYTLKFSDCLNTNETYKLYVPETVQNIFGESFGRDFTYSFTTTAKKPEFMAIESVKIEDADIADLSNIKNGDVIDVSVEYANNSDAAIDSLVSVSYYADDLLLYTESVKGETVPAGVMGAKTVPFTVPAMDIVNMEEVDRISVCLWESFENPVAYVDSFDIGEKEEEDFDVTAKEPVVKYSYSNSRLNIQGKADEESKYVTVQILKPDGSFEGEDASSDEMVVYRGQASVIDGAYSVDLRFDDVKNTDSILESGVYPARIFVDDEKIDIDEVYINSYPDFVADCKALSDAAKNDDFDEFKRIINEDRQNLNFVVGFAEENLDEELLAYFDYVKDNSLDPDDEDENAKTFKTYVAIEYVKEGKIDDVQNYMDELVVDEKVKALCSEVLYDDEVGAYFGELVSGKDIDSFDEFEDVIKEGLILTTAKYGNGYGDLKSVLEECGDVIGIEKSISTKACKALMGKTFKDGDEFKDAYNKSISEDNGSSSGTGSSSGKGSSSNKGNGSFSFSVGTINPENGEKPELVPILKEFDDIDNYEWATESILGLADIGIINGVSEKKFAPSRNVKREEFAKIIVGALKMTEYEYGGNVFMDASDGAWFTSYINISADLGIARGIGNGYFGVGQNITRQDMAVMIYNALVYRGVDTVSGELHFADSEKIADYAKTAVSALYNLGAIKGVSETEFSPDSFATRAEAAKMVYGVLGQLQN